MIRIGKEQQQQQQQPPIRHSLSVRHRHPLQSRGYPLDLLLLPGAHLHRRMRSINPFADRPMLTFGAWHGMPRGGTLDTEDARKQQQQQRQNRARHTASRKPKQGIHPQIASHIHSQEGFPPTPPQKLANTNAATQYCSPLLNSIFRLFLTSLRPLV